MSDVIGYHTVHAKNFFFYDFNQNVNFVEMVIVSIGPKDILHTP